MASAISHSQSRICGSANAPAIQNTPLTDIQIEIRRKLQRWPVSDFGTAKMTNTERPTCMKT
jgi:hypothetical protein